MAARGGEGEGWSLFSKLLISGLPDVVVSEIWASFSREQVVQWVRGKREILDSISAGAVRVLPPSIRNIQAYVLFTFYRSFLPVTKYLLWALPIKEVARLAIQSSKELSFAHGVFSFP